MNKDKETKAEVLYSPYADYIGQLQRFSGIDIDHPAFLCTPVAEERKYLKEVLAYLAAFANSLPPQDDFKDTPLGKTIERTRERLVLVEG